MWSWEIFINIITFDGTVGVMFTSRSLKNISHRITWWFFVVKSHLVPRRIDRELYLRFPTFPLRTISTWKWNNIVAPRKWRVIHERTNQLRLILRSRVVQGNREAARSTRILFAHRNHTSCTTPNPVQLAFILSVNVSAEISNDNNRYRNKMKTTIFHKTLTMCVCVWYYQ